MCIPLVTMAMRKFFQNDVLLKNILNMQLLSTAKRFSSNGRLVTASLNSDTGVATITMNHKPVNSMSVKMMGDAISALDEAEKQMGAQGIIWTSSCKGVFGAGLQLTEVFRPEPSQFQEFWTALQDIKLRLYGSPVPLIAAINGHAIAGGVIFGVAADYRILAKGNFKLGLNETAIGLPVPKMLQTMFINTLGLRTGERLLKQGTVFGCEEALAYGFADELCEPEKLMETAEKEMEKWIKIPADAFSSTKLAIRNHAIKELLSSRQEEVDFFLKVFNQPETVEILQSHLSKLSKTK